MGFLDKLKEMTRPYDDDEDFLDDAPLDAADSSVEPAEKPVRPAPERERRSSFSSHDDGGYTPPRQTAPPQRTASRDNKVVNINTTTQLKVVLVKPERFEAAAEIADQLRDKRTVVMNLEQTGKDVSRRLIDFLSGVAYAQDGKIKRVAASTFIITPYNVDLVGDLIDELESNGMYF